MKLRHLLWGLGLLASGWLALFGDKSPADGVAEPAARAVAGAPSGAVARSRPAPGVPTAPPSAILALRQREKGSGEVANARLFGVQSWSPPAASAASRSAVVAPTPPSAPPLPFTYIGKKAQDGVWEVYLARRDQTFVARARGVLEGTYRVEAISAISMTLTYLPLNQVQQLSLGPND